MPFYCAKSNRKNYRNKNTSQSTTGWRAVILTEEVILDSVCFVSSDQGHQHGTMFPDTTYLYVYTVCGWESTLHPFCIPI